MTPTGSGNESLLVVDCQGAGQRLDQWLATVRELDLSRTHAQKLISSGQVCVNRASAKPGMRLQQGDQVLVRLPLPEHSLMTAEDIPLTIVYEDEELLVVDKPAGLVVHPAPGNRNGTLANALLGYTDRLAAVNGVFRPGIVHRIDKETSGLLVVARTERASRVLTEQLQQHSVKREYLAIVCGQPEVNRGMIDAPIARDTHHRKRQAIQPRTGRRAVTHFEVLERFRDHALLRLRLETGRTHQIRVHMQFIGTPVLADPLYGTRKNRFGLNRQALHAETLGFRHPDGTWREFHAPLPNDLEQVLCQLREESG